MNIINNAINIDKQIIFQYYEYAPNKARIKKYNGRFYKLSPYKLMWNNDHYYLIGYNEKYKSLSKYRVDRIAKEITIIDNNIIHDKDNDLGKFIKRTFNMYDGEPQNIELLCENEMMNYIIDKFGEDIKTRIINSEKFIATATVSISPTFFSWVFGFNGKIVILSPDSVKFNYINLIKNQYNIYENNHDGE